MSQKMFNGVNSVKSILESILFSIGEPVSIEKLAKTLGKDEDLIKKTIEILENNYKKEERGLRIIKKENKVQLVSAPQNSQYIEKLIKNDLNQELSPASLETLAIVAYKGPISRAGIEKIRGVNCSPILRNLLIRGLIERQQKAQNIRVYLYKVSFNFLKRFGIDSIKELPEYNKLK